MDAANIKRLIVSGAPREQGLLSQRLAQVFLRIGISDQEAADFIRGSNEDTLKVSHDLGLDDALVAIDETTAKIKDRVLPMSASSVNTLLAELRAAVVAKKETTE